MPKEKTTLARPYAEAVFQLAEEQSAHPAWEAMLETLVTLVSHPDMRACLANPRFNRCQQTELLLELAGTDLSVEGGNFVRILVENRRLELLPEIAELYQEQRRTTQGTVQVCLTSAYALDATQEAELTAALRNRLGRSVTLTTDLDAELLGGMVIRAGDLVIDASLRGQLQRLGQSLGVDAS